MKKAVIYARFSCGSQTEQSIEGQLRVCQKYARENGFVVVNEYIDRKKTGRNDLRPSFQKMLADSYKHVFDFVIVYALDRFARDDGDHGTDKRILRQNGVLLLSATQQIGVNPDGTENLGGILTEGIYVALAKYYSRELAQKIRRGQAESLEKKNYLGGGVVYGYFVKDKKLCINETEADVVREMFELYSKGKSAFDIAEIFQKKGLKNSIGKEFKPNGIIKMLKNPKYIGTFKYGGRIIENYHPPIVDKRTFDIVQARIDHNMRTPAKAKARDRFILTGKLYCGYCKKQMVGESGTSRNGDIYYYYKCQGRKKRNGCTKKIVKKTDLEDLIINSTLKHILSPKNIECITEQIFKVQEEEHNVSEIEILHRQLDEINISIKNMLTAIKRGIITDSTREELENLENEKSELERKILCEEAQTEFPLTRTQLKFWFKSFADYDYNDEDARDYLVTYFINRILLYNDKAIIVFNHNGDNQTEISLTEIEEELSSDLAPLCPPRKGTDILSVPFRAVEVVKQKRRVVRASKRSLRSFAEGTPLGYRQNPPRFRAVPARKCHVVPQLSFSLRASKRSCEALPRGPLWGVGKIHLRFRAVPARKCHVVPQLSLSLRASKQS